ncbi:MAG: helix-turn-helix domain-containing protein, partial [Flavobacteriales bacterium]|nr:helix-turn-helix domain-containing protein [Flavobacteriales bacterium]
VDTKKVSFDLCKAGKNVKEIAKERGFVESTIIGHLAHYVGLGEIDIATLLPKKTIEAITKVYKKNKEISGLNELKSQLDNSISYSDIKMVLAALQKES